MNAAARLITVTQKYERGLSRLIHDDLHWLTVPQRLQYKLAVTVHCCFRYMAPVYLAGHCTVDSIYDLPDVVNCLFHVFARSPFGSRVVSITVRWFARSSCWLRTLSVRRENTSIHWTWSVSALEVVYVINIYLTTMQHVGLRCDSCFRRVFFSSIPTVPCFCCHLSTRLL